MKSNEVHALAVSGIFRGKRLNGVVEETPISWVILSGKFAFKIKKPVTRSFLDFSTLGRRRHFCTREFKLNRRFSKIYLDVIPVRVHRGTWYLGRGVGRVLDYAVQMKRKRSDRLMDKLLQSGTVTRKNIHALAMEIAGFHRKSAIIRTPFNLQESCNLFNDILSERGAIRNQLGLVYDSMLTRAIKWSDAFLQAHAGRLQARVELGFKRDVHGDLHSGNIFLYAKPVLFDCIEFSDALRRIDVLHEVAFFCMDLEAFGKKRLAQAFLSEYNALFPCILSREDKLIFNYYKCCRANVRAKVLAAGGGDGVHRIRMIREYLDLMQVYMSGKR